MNIRFCSLGKLLPYILYLLLSLILMLCWRPLQAQNDQNFKPLQVGDTVPDVVLENVLNYTSPTAKLSDFKGKLLILDFWATWCAPCVAMIPRMDSLQKHFEGKVQFLAVTSQTETEVSTFYKNYMHRNGLRIESPTAVSDQILKQLFYHNAVPHYVWIDQAGVVAAITELDQITDDNIRLFLRNPGQAFPEKKDIPRLGYDKYQTSLLHFLEDADRGLRDNVSLHTLFAPYIEGLGSEYHLEQPEESMNGKWRISFTNTAPIWIFRIGFGKGKQFLSTNTVLLEVKDTDRIYSNLSGEKAIAWARNNMNCYELVVPQEWSGRAWEFMQDDLRRLYPQYKVSVQKRSRKCLALVRTSDQSKYQSRTSRFYDHYDGMTLRLEADTFEGFVLNLNTFYLSDSKLPIIDQTGYSGRIDLLLEADLSNIVSLNAALAAYDLQLIERDAEIECLVVEDNLEQQH